MRRDIYRREEIFIDILPSPFAECRAMFIDPRRYLKMREDMYRCAELSVYATRYL